MYDMPSEAAKSWMLFIAVGLSVVAAGHIVDLLLKKEELTRLRALSRRLAKLLTETPIKRWQVRIADAGYRAIHALHGIIETIYRIVKGRQATDPYRPVSGVWVVGEPQSFVQIALMSLGLAIYPIAYFVWGWWAAGSIGFFCFLLIFYIWCEYLLRLFLRRGFSLDFYGAVGSISIISAGLSTFALGLARNRIPEALLNTRWYIAVEGGIEPAYPMLLPFLNFPFDLGTIAVTVLLLGYVRRRRSGFLAVALLDTVLSLAFSIVLYAVLLAIEAGWDFLHFHRYLAPAVVWFGDVGACFGRFLARARPIGWAGLRDVHLLPILLTTFVPVALYMSIFIFLAFCTVVMRLGARVFAVVGERDESVFKQFATLLAVILAAVKAIYDWLTVT